MSSAEFKGCVPFVGAIIERTNDAGELEVLVQTRWNPKFESIYNGTLEFAAGVLDKEYENVHDAVAREIKEETGYVVDSFIDQENTEVFTPRITDSVFGFRPYCCVQQLKDGRPWVGFIFRCRVKPGEPKDQDGETKNVHWENARDLLNIFKNKQDKLFTLEVPAWHYYFKDLGWL